MLTLDHYDAIRDGKMTPPAWYAPFKVSVPVGSCGPWRVERFTVDLDLTNLRLMRDGRGCYPGEYTRLVHAQRGIVMSDTTAEAADCLEVVHIASGRVLIHGLGLGSVLQAILARPNVKHVDVVEIDEDVLSLVGPHYTSRDDRVHLHHGDALTKKWPRGTQWNIVWHDIWDNICGDNLPQMKRLHRRFGRRCVWQGSWARKWIQQ